MDYLPVQGTSVPCERVFSSSAETDTKQRNRIGATLMEALQMQKYGLKKKRLSSVEGRAADQHALLLNDPEEPRFPSEDVDHLVEKEACEDNPAT